MVVLHPPVSHARDRMPGCQPLPLCFVDPHENLDAQKGEAAGNLFPGGLRPGVHLIRHLVSFWNQARASFPIWQSGWLSRKGLRCGLTRLPPERHSGPSKFYSPQPSDIQVLDGGGSDAHVITFAQTHTTQTMVELLRGSQRSPHTRTPWHADTRGCRAEAQVGAEGRGSPSLCPQSTSAPRVFSPSDGGWCWEKGLQRGRP